jgi:hypothetical protein
VGGKQAGDTRCCEFPALGTVQPFTLVLTFVAHGKAKLLVGDSRWIPSLFPSAPGLVPVNLTFAEL